MSRSLTISALPGIPLVEPGDDIAALIIAAVQKNDNALHDGDVLVIAQKIISKAENRYVALASVNPSAQALELSAQCGKDPRLVEVILAESKEVIAYRPHGVLIVEHRLGYVHANAGVDASNIGGNDRVLLLPKDANASAAALRQAIHERLHVDIKIIINDSAGRAWRTGVIGFAIGCAGFKPLVNLIGTEDLFGRKMQITEVAVADELASAASFVMGQAAEGCPVVLIRGAGLPTEPGDANMLLRPKEQDLFR